MTSTDPQPASSLSARSVGLVMLLVASVLWSVSGVAVKLAAMDSIAFAFYRSLAAGLAAACLMPLASGAMPPAKWMAVSVVLYAMVVSLLITAMTAGTAASGILLQYTGPIFCALFAWLLQGRRISKRTAVALGIGILGIAIMIVGADAPPKTRPVNYPVWLGPVCGLLSGVAFGALILILEKVDRPAFVGARPVNAISIVMFNNLGTAALLLPIVLSLGVLKATPTQLAIVALTGAIQLALPYVLFQFALRRVNPVDASLLILLEPVLNPVWVWLAVGERPDVATFIGGAAILTAMVVEATKPTDET